MDKRILLIGALVVALALAGCMGDGGGPENASTEDGGEDGTMDDGGDAGGDSGDSAGTGGDGSMEDDGSTAGDSGDGGGSMSGDAAMSGPLGGCNADSMTFAELEQRADFQSAMQASPQGSSMDDISGSVTVHGVVERDGHRTCHFTVQYDEPIGGDQMEVTEVEMWGGDEYVHMVYYDSSGTTRLELTQDGDTPASMTMYDEQGNEINIPTGGQMPSGDMPSGGMPGG